MSSTQLTDSFCKKPLPPQGGAPCWEEEAYSALICSIRSLSGIKKKRTAPLSTRFASLSVLRTGSRPMNPPSVITGSGSSVLRMIGEALMELMVPTRYLASSRLACR